MFGFGGPPQGDSDETELYDILGVEKTATAAQIKKAFRKAAMKHHPDRGGDAELFKKANKAHEILSDPQKREVYDKYGMEGLEGGGGGGGGGPADIFEMFGMGGGGRRRGPSGPRKGESITFPLKVSLAELYNGCEKRLRLSKSVLCKACDAKGGKGPVEVCGTCRGRGVRIVVRQIGPGMLQQMQCECDACSGRGKIVSDICEVCVGKCVVKEKKTLSVHVNRGASHGDRIVFRGEADEAPGTVAGDVIVVLQQLEHEEFTRRGPDLFVKKSISLCEALTGFAFTVAHLDDRTLVVRSKDGQVVSPGQVLAVEGEGFPHPKNPFQRGKLYIEFDVEFPSSGELQANTVKLLKRVLPDAGTMDLDLPAEHEDVDLQEVDLEEERRRFEQQQHSREAYDEDEDGGGHPMGGCRQA